MNQAVTQDSDWLVELLGRCALRDPKALRELYQATSAKLFAVALAVVRREAFAEEILQEAYIKIWKAADSYNAAKGRPMTWMINIVRNQSLDLLRGSEHRHAADDAAALEQMQAPHAVDEQVEGRTQMERLRRCMEQLAPDQRRCLLLIYQSGCTPTEVSRSSGWPVDKVKYWARTSLTKMRGCLAG